jgi:KDO2-lipid IV(A) lauroyltransferase
MFFLLSALPLFWARGVGRCLGRAVAKVMKSRGRLASGNLSRAFPQASPSQIQEWVRQVWENLGQSLAEFACLPRFSTQEFFAQVKVEGLENLQKALDRKRGVIVFTAHFGNWEIITAVLALSGFPLAVVARRMKNPYVNDFITKIRSASGAKVLMHKQAVRESMRWLKQGKVLGLLLDQRITDGGAVVPFFGRPAHTTTMAALLALRMETPVVPISCRREDGRLEVRIDPPLDFSQYQAKEEDILKATAEMTEVMEKWIQERPPLWLWIHDRWKI